MGHRAAVERRGPTADVGPAVHPVRVDDARRGSGGRGVAHCGADSMDFARGQRGNASSQPNACRRSIDRLAAFQSCELGSQDCAPLGKTTDAGHPRGLLGCSDPSAADGGSSAFIGGLPAESLRPAVGAVKAALRRSTRTVKARPNVSESRRIVHAATRI